MSNTLSFQRLQQGLQKITDIGRIEEIVNIGGIEFRLRTLRSNDHKKVNAFVSAYMQQYEGEESAYPLDATMDFFNVRKKEPLAHAIQSIGDLDLEGISYIETGEVDSHGNMVKKEKHVFVRELLGDMDISVTEVLHRKYADMLVAAEKKAAANVKFRDPEEELATLEVRRAELYKELGKELPENQKKVEGTEEMTEEKRLSLEALKKAAFSPISEEEVPEKLGDRVSTSSLQSETNEGLAEESSPNTEVESKFIRLDDPETPYTEVEQEYLEEQERIFQQRYGDSEGDEASARLQKRRRQPLNQTAPQVHQGSLPSHQQAQGRRIQEPVQAHNLPLAEGFEDRVAPTLPSPKKNKMGTPSYNPAPSGSPNPNFKNPYQK